MTMGTCGSLVAFKPRDRNRQLRAFIFPKDCPTRGGALARGVRGRERGKGEAVAGATRGNASTRFYVSPLLASL